MDSKRIQAAIFDYGGVLAQTRQHEPRAAWERRLGLAPGALTRLVHDDQVWVAAQTGQLSAAAHWQAVQTRLQLTDAALVALQADFYQGDVVNTALLTCIARLQQAGIRLGLLSNFSTDLRAMLVQQELLQWFDPLVISAEIGVMKPAAAAYETILARLELPASVCVFIDDLPANVAAAQALGMHGIVFDDTTACVVALERLCLRST
jgi:putative hydrolase of the HAD superfamily